jgi:XTP/dITP diphosphohydrolase
LQNWDKVVEEIHELNNEIDKKDTIRIESEYGDVLFALISYSRFLGINPEDALERCNRRFIKRFQLMEKELKNEDKELSKMSLKEMDKYWELAKKQYHNK